MSNTASTRASRLQYQSIGPDCPFSKTLSGFKIFGRKKSRVSVKVEMVPKIQMTAASVSNAGSVTARPVKKLARQLERNVFLTRIFYPCAPVVRVQIVLPASARGDFPRASSCGEAAVLNH